MTEGFKLTFLALGLVVTAAVTLTVCRLAGVIAWPWVWVLAPLWVEAVLAVAALFGIAGLVAVFKLLDRWE